MQPISLLCANSLIILFNNIYLISVMARIVLFPTGAVSDGKIVKLPDDLKKLLDIASEKFQFEVKCAYTTTGEKVEDITSLIDGQLLYVDEEEHFNREGNEYEGANAVVSGRKQKEWVRLNVGGTYFTTTRTTLMKEPASMLARMFDDHLGMVPSEIDDTGAFLIDRDPTHFAVILNFLRDGRVSTPAGLCNQEGLLNEAIFYGLESLVEILKRPFTRHFKAISRDDIVKMLIPSVDKTKLTLLKHANLAACDLSSLYFNGINFEGTCFRGCNLTSADLSGCRLENADFRDAILQQCIFSNARMRGVILTGVNSRASSFQRTELQNSNIADANLQNCTFDGTILTAACLKSANLSYSILRKCIFEGAVLQDAVFEEACIVDGSFLYANLRGANLQNTYLRNSDLRWADLSQADLRGCQLLALQTHDPMAISACDVRSNGPNLSEVNLKGANLQGVSLQCCDMQGADLRGADLRNSDLTFCWLVKEEMRDSTKNVASDKCLMRNSVLEGANLQKCDLKYCNLVGALLKGANVEGVIIEEERRETLLALVK